MAACIWGVVGFLVDSILYGLSHLLGASGLLEAGMILVYNDWDLAYRLVVHSPHFQVHVKGLHHRPCTCCTPSFGATASAGAAGTMAAAPCL
jgi:hypothetical protein